MKTVLDKSFQQQKLVFLIFINDELQLLMTSSFVIEERDVNDLCLGNYRIPHSRKIHTTTWDALFRFERSCNHINQSQTTFIMTSQIDQK